MVMVNMPALIVNILFFLFSANPLCWFLRHSKAVAAWETHQQTLVSEEDGVGEGRTRTVVTGDRDGVQTAGSSRHLGQCNKNTKLTFLINIGLKYYQELLSKTTDSRLDPPIDPLPMK